MDFHAARVSDLALGSGRDPALDPVLALALDLDRDLGPALDLDLGLDLDLDLDLDPGLTLALGPELGLGPDLVSGVDLDLGPGRDHGRALNLEPALGPGRDLGRDLDIGLEPGLDSVPVRAIPAEVRGPWALDRGPWAGYPRGVIERSELLAGLAPGVIHGFSTRQGGVSTGRHGTLNLSGSAGDDPANVAENLRRLAAAGGFELDRLVRVRQVHGARVVSAARAGPDVEADALWTTREDDAVVVAVHTADCVPVLLADRAGRAVAAVHAGWRGVVGGVLPATVAALGSVGVRAVDLVAAVGPCIEQAAFEVGPEVAERFPSPVVRTGPSGRPHVDLVAAVRLQLLGCGLPGAAIERVGGCTHANPERYFSYRRDGAGMGQHLSFIGFSDREP